MESSQDRHITNIITSHSRRLMGFIRTYVTSDEDAEDILQDVFYQLTESILSMRPIEQLTSWLFTVARNKITDRYRKRKHEPMHIGPESEEEDQNRQSALEGLLFDATDTPESIYMRSLFWRAFEEALDELPPAQKEVFVMHEIEGISFNEISATTGLGINTLLSRKRYAVLHLRKRLHDLRDEFLNS